MNLNITNLSIYFTVSFLLSIIILFFSIFLSSKFPDKEKVSIYECGFNPFHLTGQPFSIRFFLIAILFLIFDLEIIYLFPWSVNSNLIDYFSQLIIFLFILILIIGLIYEWFKGGLEWE